MKKLLFFFEEGKWCEGGTEEKMEGKTVFFQNFSLKPTGFVLVGKENGEIE